MKKDVNDKKAKSSKDALKGFKLPAASSGGAAAPEEPAMNIDAIKEAMMKGAFVQDSCTMEDLAGDDWQKVLGGHARQEDLKQLCEPNALGKQGSKDALTQRIFNHLKGGEDE